MRTNSSNKGANTCECRRDKVREGNRFAFDAAAKGVYRGCSTIPSGQIISVRYTATCCSWRSPSTVDNRLKAMQLQRNIPARVISPSERCTARILGSPGYYATRLRKLDDLLKLLRARARPATNPGPQCCGY